MTIRIFPVSQEELASSDIVQRLRDFNFAHVGEYHYGNSGQSLPLRYVNLDAQTEDGRVIGGIRGFVILSLLRIEVIFVDAAARGQGVGARLLAEAEQLARGMGAKNAALETFEFQAPQFYAKLGYVEVSRIERYAKDFYLAAFTKAL